MNILSIEPQILRYYLFTFYQFIERYTVEFDGYIPLPQLLLDPPPFYYPGNFMSTFSLLFLLIPINFNMCIYIFLDMDPFTKVLQDAKLLKKTESPFHISYGLTIDPWRKVGFHVYFYFLCQDSALLELVHGLIHAFTVGQCVHMPCSVWRALLVCPVSKSACINSSEMIPEL